LTISPQRSSSLGSTKSYGEGKAVLKPYRLLKTGFNSMTKDATVILASGSLDSGGQLVVKSALAQR